MLPLKTNDFKGNKWKNNNKKLQSEVLQLITAPYLHHSNHP
jgi:hypothetical protein